LTEKGERLPSSHVQDYPNRNITKARTAPGNPRRSRHNPEVQIMDVTSNSTLDPIPDRLLVEPKQLGDVGDGEEFFFHEIGLGGRVVAGLVPSDPAQWRHGAVMLSFVGAVSPGSNQNIAVPATLRWSRHASDDLTEPWVAGA
jgi:hypothetical protein